MFAEAAPANPLLATPRKALAQLSQKPLASQAVSVKPTLPSNSAQEGAAVPSPSPAMGPPSALQHSYLDAGKQVKPWKADGRSGLS